MAGSDRSNTCPLSPFQHFAFDTTRPGQFLEYNSHDRKRWGFGNIVKINSRRNLWENPLGWRNFINLIVKLQFGWVGDLSQCDIFLPQSPGNSGSKAKKWTSLTNKQHQQQQHSWAWKKRKGKCSVVRANAEPVQKVCQPWRGCCGVSGAKA